MSETIKNNQNNSKNTQKPYQTTIKGPSLTQKQFQKQCSIKHIMRGYQKSGYVNHLVKNHNKPQFLNQNKSTKDWQTAQNILCEAKSKFEQLPEKVKQKFNNNYQNAIEFMSNPKNLNESITLGLIPEKYKKKEPQKEVIQKVQIVNEDLTKNDQKGQENKKPEPEKGQAAV